MSETVRRFLETPFEARLRRALVGGDDFRIATRPVVDQHLTGFVSRNLDIVLRLMIEGGNEAVPLWRLTRPVLMKTPEEALRAAVRPLVDQVIFDENSNSWNECNGLLILLAELRLIDWIAEVAISARECTTDGDVGELVAGYGELIAAAGQSLDHAASNLTLTWAAPPREVRENGRESAGADTAWKALVAAYNAY